MEKTGRYNNIVEIIIVSHLQFGFDKEKLRVQCYDGCSTMMCKKESVSKQIKNVVRPLSSTTYSLNLTGSDS